MFGILFLGWLASVATIAVPLGAAWILWSWWTGDVVGTGWAFAGVAMLLWAVAGRYFVLAFYPRGTDEPDVRHRTLGVKVATPDGAKVHVEQQGGADKPALVLTHGWTLDSEAWFYARKHLAGRYRLILWDLPGLGQSPQPADGTYSVEKLAADLRAVIDQSGARRVMLVGHSIGGMMMLTLCRLYPDLVLSKINGLVFIDTTYTFPLETATGGKLLRALQRPVIEPALHLTVWLWPLAWMTNWLTYFNGTAHLLNRLALFGKDVTRGQLDAGAWYIAKDHPGVVAKGILAVLHWNEEATLSRIFVPARVITGTSDRLTRPEAAEEMKKRIAICDLVRIEPAGHNGVLEKGEQYARAIDDAARRFGHAPA